MKNEIEKLLSAGILQDFSFENGKYNLTVKEPDNCKPNELSEFKIVDLPERSIAFSLDYRIAKGEIRQHVNNSRVKNFSWLISRSHKKANKKSDIIIIVPKPRIRKHLVIIGELKTSLSRANITKANEQIKNSRLVLNFVFELLKEHEKVEIENLDFRSVVFSNDGKARVLNERTLSRYDRYAVTILHSSHKFQILKFAPIFIEVFRKVY